MNGNISTTAKPNAKITIPNGGEKGGETNHHENEVKEKGCDSVTTTTTTSKKQVTILENGQTLQVKKPPLRRLSASIDKCSSKNMSTMNEKIDTLHVNAEVISSLFSGHENHEKKFLKVLIKISKQFLSRF